MSSIINFSENRLPPSLSLGAIGGPEFNTSISQNANGFERRNINWLYARAKYDISPAIKTLEQVETLQLFFRAHKGKALGFRFKDWNDYNTFEEIQLISDGETKSFQLIKNYALGDVSDVRLIRKPVKESLIVYADNHSLKVNCDYTTGMVSMREVPKAGTKITASFAFDVPVRFDVDFLPFSGEAIPRITSIPLIEIRV